MLRRCLPLLLLCGVAACATDAGVTVSRSERGADTTQAQPPPTVPSTVPATGAGADGVGDVLFPELGNPGIDVDHYGVDLAYDPVTDLIEAAVTIDLQLTDDRDSITLDAQGPEVTEVVVDGADASFRMDSPELRIDLPAQGRAGDELEVVVHYGLHPQPQPSAIGMNNGWHNTPGGSYVLNEPDGARTWLPCNDHPGDKAAYTFTLTVPTGLTAVANGALLDHRSEVEHEVWVWEETRPMATYLIQLLTGDYELVRGTGPHGLELLSVVLRSDLQAAQPALDTMGPQIEFFEQYFGEYPLDRYGIALTDSFSGLAMETQERSLFSRDDFIGLAPHQMLLSHELAHQWFGNAVTPARWQDIWLNESFATYGQWLWLEHVGEQTLADAAEEALMFRSIGATGTPDVPELFGYNSYEGGAVVLHALRGRIGDDAFFTLLRRWVEEYNGTSRTTQEFIAFAEDVAGEPLGSFFDEWLFAAQTPTQYPL